MVAARIAEQQAKAAARREEKEARVQEQMEEARIQTAQRSGGASLACRLPCLLTSTAAEAMRRILLALDEAPEKLRQHDAMMSPLISLRNCGGLTIEQAAEVLKSSRVTAFRLWTFDRARLHHKIAGD